MSRLPYYSGLPINRSCPTPLGLSYSFRASIGFSSFLLRSGPGPLPLHCPTVYFRFVGDSAMGEVPGSRGAPLLYGIVVPRKNKAPPLDMIGCYKSRTSYHDHHRSRGCTEASAHI